MAASAYKHGIFDGDIPHVWRNVLRLAEQDDDGQSRVIAVAPARDGALLELVLVPDGAPTRVVHADHARLDFRDASGVRAIIAAADAVSAAQESLRQAVARARAGGDSWSVTGAALGTSKQAAHERFRALADH